MKRKVIAIIIALFVVIVNSSFRVSANDEMNFENMVNDQAEACEAHEKLIAWFNQRGVQFPNDFGGDYIDNGILHVLLTTEESVNMYNDILKDYVAVKYEIVPKSYNDLMKKARETFERYEKEGFVLSFSVRIQKNCGVIYVKEESYQMAKNLIVTDEILVEPSGEIKEEASVVAGSTLNNWVTLGGSGTYNGAPAFITCGHTLSGGMSITYGGSTIGTVCVNVHSPGVSGDYSIISAASGYTATSSVFTTSGNTTNFTGYQYHPAVGTYLYKYGRVSGQAFCQVTDYQVTSNGFTNIVKAKLISGYSQGGDSGGPYRNGTSFCGVHHGSGTINGITYVYFTPYETINGAGFSIKTN